MIALSVALACAVALVGTLWLHVPWASVLTLGLVLSCLLWLVVVLTLPWNLHFQAKGVLFEMKRARERGLAVRGDREEEARRVARRMLRLSIALHLASAGLAATLTAAMSGRWGYVLSAAYLLSGLFRPGVEYYRYLRRRLGLLGAEVTFPPDDVKALKAQVERLRVASEACGRAQVEARQQLDVLTKASQARHRELELRFTALARKFEETVDRLTDNQQIISGIKAFLRLVQTPEPSSEPPSS